MDRDAISLLFLLVFMIREPGKIAKAAPLGSHDSVITQKSKTRGQWQRLQS